MFVVVFVGVKLIVFVGVFVIVWVGVFVGLGVSVGVLVGVFVGVRLNSGVSVGVVDGVFVGRFVLVILGVGELDVVGFGVHGALVFVGVDVLVGCIDLVGVELMVDVGVSGILQTSKLPVGELVIEGVGVCDFVNDIVGVFVGVGYGAVK